VLKYAELQKMAAGELEHLLSSLSRNRPGSFRNDVCDLALKCEPRDVKEEYRYAVLIQRVLFRKQKMLARRQAKADANFDPAAAGVVVDATGRATDFPV